MNGINNTINLIFSLLLYKKYFNLNIWQIIHLNVLIEKTKHLHHIYLNHTTILL